MSRDQNALLTEMAKENLSLGGMLQEKPPQMQDVNPELADKGLKDLRVHMSENAYNTFLTIMHWAITCQKLSEGEKIQWGDESFACMQAPFVGFGNAFHWESSYKDNLGKLVHAIYINWHTDGASERYRNKLPHRLVKEIAPLLSNMSRGWDHMMMVKDMVSDGKIYEQL